MAKRTTQEIPAEFCKKLSARKQRTLSMVGNYCNDENAIQRYYMLGFLENLGPNKKAKR